MFKFDNDKEELVWWPVYIQVPVDHGKTKKYKVECQFLLLPNDEYKEQSRKGDLEFLQFVLRDWKHFADMDGNELPFDKENRILRRAYVQISMVNGYNQMRAGIASKN